MNRLLLLSFLVTSVTVYAAEPAWTENLWPGQPPGAAVELPPEADQTKAEDALIAGRRIIKLGNVSIPQLAVYKPAPEKDTGAAIVICPGGGHHILAYDLEGTEVAAWLNGLGVTGIVLKYRVPFRDPERRWLAAVQDGQRAVSVARARAEDWRIDPDRLGILGFSAGGQTAGFVGLLGNQRQYDTVDDADAKSCVPDLMVLIYPGGFLTKDEQALDPDLKVTAEAPPAFFVHADDDGVSSLNTLMLATALRLAKVSTETHIYAKGGHGYGLRHVDGMPVTDWPQVCALWLGGCGFLESKLTQ